MMLLRLFWEFFKIGLFAVGGGMATIPFLYDLSDRTGWFTYTQLADMIAISESTPGPIGVNMSTYVGYEMAGIAGSIFTTLGFVAPSIIIIIIVSIFLQKFRDNRYVESAFYGLRPASSGLIASAALSVAIVALLAPVLESLKQLGRFTDAELTAAVVSAMFTVFIKKTDQSDEVPFGEVIPPEVQVDAPDKTSVELAPGAFIDLNPGEDVQFADPKHPTTGFEAFMNAIVKQMAAALEIPSEVLYKQFSTSYSAARGALNEFWRTTGMHRDWFADYFCQPVYEAWFREAVCKGRIKAPGFLVDPAVAAAYMSCTWNGPARTNLNPKDEAEAAQMRVNSGFSTAAQETAQMTGGSYEANMRQRKSEAALKREVDDIAGVQAQQQTAVPQRSGGDPGKNE